MTSGDLKQLLIEVNEMADSIGLEDSIRFELLETVMRCYKKANKIDSDNGAAQTIPSGITWPSHQTWADVAGHPDSVAPTFKYQQGQATETVYTTDNTDTMKWVASDGSVRCVNETLCT